MVADGVHPDRVMRCQNQFGVILAASSSSVQVGVVNSAQSCLNLPRIGAAFVFAGWSIGGCTKAVAE